jgi:hypothetical protein
MADGQSQQSKRYHSCRPGFLRHCHVRENLGLPRNRESWIHGVRLLRSRPGDALRSQISPVLRERRADAVGDFGDNGCCSGVEYRGTARMRICKPARVPAGTATEHKDCPVGQPSKSVIVRSFSIVDSPLVDDFQPQSLLSVSGLLVCCSDQLILDDFGPAPVAPWNRQSPKNSGHAGTEGWGPQAAAGVVDRPKCPRRKSTKSPHPINFRNARPPLSGTRIDQNLGHLHYQARPKGVPILGQQYSAVP